jgi:uncharacterized protein
MIGRPYWQEIIEPSWRKRPIVWLAGGGKQEVVRRPKLYGFDTGFVAYVHGWHELHGDESGVLWEHLVLDALRARPDVKVAYWRDKSGREIDFVVPRGRSVDIYECKLTPTKFTPDALRVFRSLYRDGHNFVVTPGGGTPYDKLFGGIVVRFVGIEQLLLPP